ncbi:MAG: MFS transporter [Acidiferrobacterales bacterium]
MTCRWSKETPLLAPDTTKRFRRIATAGIFFQGGAAAVDTSTIIAALVHGLTGSTYAVGAAAALSRYGWLFPQLFVGYLAQRRQRRMPFYMIGAFGRVACLAGVAGLLAVAGDLPSTFVITLFFVLWTVYAFVSGIVAVPYNDIVARSVPSARRSRLLAIRFFGGGLLALGVAATAHELLNTLTFTGGYAAVVLLGAALLLISSLSFVSAGEPIAPLPQSSAEGFVEFLRQGVAVFRTDRRFRLFVYTQWLGGGVVMAVPFYILQVIATEGTAAQVAFLLGAQTAGALLSNALWGWWGDRHGKQSLFQAVLVLRAAPPLLILFWVAMSGAWGVPTLAGFAVVFLLLGAVDNGITIAMLGYLMEISPDDQRPAYSGYFNALVAPAALLPLAGAAIVEATSLAGVFLVSLAFAVLQFLTVRRLRVMSTGDSTC